MNENEKVNKEIHDVVESILKIIPVVAAKQKEALDKLPNPIHIEFKDET